VKFSWKDIYSEAELFKSALKMYLKPLYTPSKGFIQSKDQVTFYDFAINTSKNLEMIHKSLIKENFIYKPGIVKKMEVNGKTKCLYIYPWEEKIVDTVLYRSLTKKFDSYFSNQSFAYKPSGSGVDFCQHKIKKFLNQYDTVYVIKRDISNFFPSINHTVLKEKVKEIITDPFILKLLDQRIEFQYYTNDTDIETAKVGIPFGTPIACFLANLFLDGVDKTFDKQENVGYFRYADDFLIATPDREKALELISLFEEEVVVKRKALCKPSHHQNLILTKEKLEDDVFTSVTKFKHLGLEFRADKTVGLSRDKVRKILNLVKRKFKVSTRLYKKLSLEKRVEKLIELTNEVITEGLKSVAIIDYYLKHVSDENQLRMIDRYIAETILATATRRGYKKSNFKLYPYKKMRDFGLFSLVHRKRLIGHGHIESSFFQLRNTVKEEAFKKKVENRKKKRDTYKTNRLSKRVVGK